MCSRRPHCRVSSGRRPPPSTAPSTRPYRARSAETYPLTNTIRRAFAAGTRDATGRPGPNYWQLRTDYTIEARLDPPTDTLTGSETIALHNTSPDALNEIVLRLDHNIFRGVVPRGTSVPAENTEGMVVTSLSVDGNEVDLNAAPGFGGRGGRGRGNQNQPRRLAVSGLDQTVARVSLAAPIAAGATATLKIAWHTKLPGGPGRGHRMTQRWDDTLFQPVQWYPRVAVYDDLRGWDTEPVPRTRGVLQQLRPLRRHHRRAGRLDRQRHRPAAERAGGPHADGARTPDARPRFRRHDHDRGRERERTGARDRRGRSAQMAVPCRYGQRLRLGDRAELRVAGDPGHHPGQGPGSDLHGVPAEGRASYAKPATSPVMRCSSIRSCGRPIRFRR